MTNPNPSPIGIGFGFVLFGAGVLTEPNKKHSKINGLWQPTNKMNNCFLLNFMDTLSKGEIVCLYLE